MKTYELIYKDSNGKIQSEPVEARSYRAAWRVVEYLKRFTELDIVKTVTMYRAF